MAEKVFKKVDDFPKSFVVFKASLTLAFPLLGVLVTFLASGLYASLVFVALWALWLYAGMYVICRHCYYYGRWCSTGAGKLTTYFFKKKERPAPLINFVVWLGFYAVLMGYPLFFVYRVTGTGQFVFYSLLFLVVPVGSTVIMLTLSCPRCKEEECPFNPDKEKVPHIE